MSKDLHLDLDELQDELAEIRLRIRDQGRIETCLDNAGEILSRMSSRLTSKTVIAAADEQIAELAAALRAARRELVSCHDHFKIVGNIGGVFDVEPVLRQVDAALGGRREYVNSSNQKKDGDE